MKQFSEAETDKERDVEFTFRADEQSKIFSHKKAFKTVKVNTRTECYKVVFN
jgi:hypothetical protein